MDGIVFYKGNKNKNSIIAKQFLNKKEQSVKNKENS